MSSQLSSFRQHGRRIDSFAQFRGAMFEAVTKLDDSVPERPLWLFINIVQMRRREDIAEEFQNAWNSQ
jgi:hypothetical protein